MPFSKEIREQAIVESARHCAVCHKHKGVNVEVHHIIPEEENGPNTLANAICLCFDCHSDAGHYNSKHPRGTKLSRSELLKHKELWKRIVLENKIPLAKDSTNLLHVQYYVCMRPDLAKKILEKNMESFPLDRVLLMKTPVLDYQSELLDKGPQYYWLKMGLYKNETEYQSKHPEAFKDQKHYPYYNYTRVFKRGRLGKTNS